MTKSLLLGICFVLPLAIFAQLPYLIDSSTERTAVPLTRTKQFAPDTTASDPLFEACSETAVLIGAQSGGFVFGSNGNGDVIKLQRIRYELGDPYLVTGVLIAFGSFDQNIADTYIDVGIYDDLRADSTFGNLLGVSDSVRVGDVRLDETRVLYTTFNFSEPVRVEADSFLVAVNVARTYATPTPGYVGILSTDDNCGDGKNVLEIFPQGGNLVYTDVQNRWGLDAEMFIRVAIETDPNTSTRQPLADYSSQVAPNPTGSYLQLSYQSAGNQPFTATLTDLTGRTLFTQRSTTVSGRNTFDWDVSTLPTGLYLYHLDGPSGRQSGKVVKR